ncbi:ADP-dependent DNA helicase RecQ, putative [Plasmodium ovale]|uniref:DNA 3'-5' helicase n=1 Tax=Plasmodium ovale TaxID=36330 RepID=A0A1D3TME8_PLAOA|nr:ADP-dependent DNA helicase RecQ, putative [Plasmodium ovale]
MLKYVEVTRSSEGEGQSDGEEKFELSVEEMRKKMEVAQKKHFGYKNLKDFQVEAVHAAFHKRDSFIVMATGMGKSLCYQIPSLMKEAKKKITVVISPLISLMKDQVDGLNRKKISSVFLGSGQKMSNENVVTEIKQGIYNIVYCSPEYALNNKNFFTILKKRILVLAIDEVHCMSEWGHDFRPSYRKLNELRNILKGIPIMCLTATCTKDVQSDILKNLNFDLNKCLIKRSSVNKTNLFYSVREKTNIYDDLRYILDIPLKKCIQRSNRFVDNSKICPYNSTLIYVNTKKECEGIYDFLNERGLSVKMYHGDLTNEEKKESHEKFLKDEIQIVIATVAFGMGIDKPDIRRIIHYGFSKSLEAYVQQVGRAGRDNSDAEAILFFHINDESKIKNIILREYTANRLIETNFSRVDHIINMFTQASDYAYSTLCRRKKIYDYFDEKPQTCEDINIFNNNDNHGICFYVQKYDTFLCNKCDNCTHEIAEIRKKEKGSSITSESVRNSGGTFLSLLPPDTVTDLTNELKILLSCISSLNGKTGISTICKILVKSKEANILKKNYQNLKEYGEGTHKSTNWWSSFMKVARNDHYIKETLNFSNDISYISIGITTKGENFIKGENKYVIKLPFFLMNTDKKNKKGKGKGNNKLEPSSGKDLQWKKGHKKDIPNERDKEDNFESVEYEHGKWESTLGDNEGNPSEGENRSDDYISANGQSNHPIQNRPLQNMGKIGLVHGASAIRPAYTGTEQGKGLPEGKYDYFNVDRDKLLKEYADKDGKLTNAKINDSLMKIVLRTRMLEARRQNIPPFQLISDQPLKDICCKRLTVVHLIRKHVDNISPICPNSFLEKIASGVRGFCLLHDLETNININGNASLPDGRSNTSKDSSLKKFTNLIAPLSYDQGGQSGERSQTRGVNRLQIDGGRIEGRNVHHDQERNFHYDQERNFHYDQERNVHYDQQKNVHHDQQRNVHYDQQRNFHYDQQRNFHYDQQRNFHYDQQRNFQFARGGDRYSICHGSREGDNRDRPNPHGDFEPGNYDANKGDSCDQVGGNNYSQFRGNSYSQFRGNSYSQFRGSGYSQFMGRDCYSQCRGSTYDHYKGSSYGQFRGNDGYSGGEETKSCRSSYFNNNNRKNAMQTSMSNSKYDNGQERDHGEDEEGDAYRNRDTHRYNPRCSQGNIQAYRDNYNNVDDEGRNGNSDTCLDKENINHCGNSVESRNVWSTDHTVNEPVDSRMDECSVKTNYNCRSTDNFREGEMKSCEINRKDEVYSQKDEYRHNDFDRYTPSGNMKNEYDKEKITTLNTLRYQTNDPIEREKLLGEIGNNLSKYIHDDFMFIDEMQKIEFNGKNTNLGNSTVYDGKGDLSNFTYEGDLKQREQITSEWHMDASSTMANTEQKSRVPTHLKLSDNFTSASSTSSTTAQRNNSSSENVWARGGAPLIGVNVGPISNVSRNDLSSIVGTSKYLDEKNINVANEKKKKFDLIESFSYDNSKNYEENMLIQSTNAGNAPIFRDLKKRKF